MNVGKKIAAAFGVLAAGSGLAACGEIPSSHACLESRGDGLLYLVNPDGKVSNIAGLVRDTQDDYGRRVYRVYEGPASGINVEIDSIHTTCKGFDSKTGDVIKFRMAGFEAK